MHVSVEKVSNVLYRLTIVVPADQIEAAYDKQINHISKHASIKGFRPGKAPLSFIKQRYGSEARQEALSEVIKSTLSMAIQQEKEKNEKLNPISVPEISPKVVKPDHPLEYTATFEVLPDIEEVKLNLAQIEKPLVKVSDSDVDFVVEQIRKQHTDWNKVDRPAMLSDRVVIDYHAIFEGKSDIDNKIQRFPLELGSGAMIPGFEDGLLGIKAGEERTLNLKFPDDFKATEKASKPVDFIVQAHQIFEAKKPELNDAFIKTLGIESGELEALKKQIKDSLTLECDRLTKEKVKEQVFNAILEQNQMEVPNSLVQREVKAIHDEVHPNHYNHHDHSPAELATYNEIAKKRVALGLLLAEYAKKFNIKADAERVQQRIQEIASSYQQPEEVVKWLMSEERLPGLEAQIVEDQVLEKIAENIPMLEKEMSYAELKDIRV